MTSDFLTTLLANAWSILLVALFFGGSIFVHELGHFLAARWRGAKVERFSIGFGPAVFSWHGRDGVEYRLAWFPLGGYVLLPQLADLGPVEGKSEVDVEKLPPVTYSTKMIVFVAGACFNVLFAFALASIIWVIGQPESSETASTSIGYVSQKIELPGGVKVTSPAMEAGLRVGDIIKAIDGRPVRKFFDIYVQIGLGSGLSADGRRQAVFTLQREGKIFDVIVHPQLAGEESERRVGIAPGYQLSVFQVAPGSIAAKAGFHPDDLILSLDGQPVLSFQTWQDVLELSAKRAVIARVQRAGREVALTLPVRAPAKSANAFGLALTTGYTLIHPTPFAQIRDQVLMSYRTLWSLINPHSDIGLSKLSGPVGIVRIFHSAAEAGIRPVLMFTILLNISLAIFNLLPLPVLDGGQMMFATIGRLRGRALSANFIMAANGVFILLLLTMVVYISVFDVRRMNGDRAETAAPASAPAANPVPVKP
ncbi:MAG: regulator of sigma E protease [Verrucomicrobia bacterium]|nr:MAG: regulator of sigma E protease [Verrucomicrobiota bacterium]